MRMLMFVLAALVLNFTTRIGSVDAQPFSLQAEIKLTIVTKQKRVNGDRRVAVHYESPRRLKPDVYVATDWRDLGHTSLRPVPHSLGKVQTDLPPEVTEPVFRFRLHYSPHVYLDMRLCLTDDRPDYESLPDFEFQIHPGRDVTYVAGNDVYIDISINPGRFHGFVDADVFVKDTVGNDNIGFARMWSRDKGNPITLASTRFTTQDLTGQHSEVFRLRTAGSPRGFVVFTGSALCQQSCLMVFLHAATNVRFYPSSEQRPFTPGYIGFTAPHPPWQNPYCFASGQCEIRCKVAGDGPNTMSISRWWLHLGRSLTEEDVRIWRKGNFFMQGIVSLNNTGVHQAGIYRCVARSDTYIISTDIKLTVCGAGGCSSNSHHLHHHH